MRFFRHEDARLGWGGDFCCYGVPMHAPVRLRSDAGLLLSYFANQGYHRGLMIESSPCVLWLRRNPAAPPVSSPLPVSPGHR